MPIVVKAVPKAEFNQWLAAERAKHAPPVPAAAPAGAVPAAEASAPATAAADKNAPAVAANAAG
jgi:cytochrome c oxidase subunit II